jgi:putative heme-binding domain-containing protein
VRLLGRCARRRIAPQPAGETQPGETDAEVGASIDVLGALLGPQSPAAVQTAAVESLGLIPSDEVPGVLLRNWQSHGPQLRSRVLDRLLSRTQWLPAAVRALSEHVIQPGELDASRRRRLVELTQGKEREEVERLLSASAAPSVEASLARFTAAKQLQGRTDTGAVVFQKRCAPCHRLAGSGHAVGPDLTALADRSFDALLAAVIDPNRAVESKYVQYTAVLRSGAILSGIIQEERSTSVTLLGQDGKQDVLLRRDLVQLESSGKSLMPESIEKDLSVEDLADLFALLKESFPAPKTFIGNEPRVVRPAADGSLDLSASTCEVHGPTLEIEPQHLNLGMWSSAADMALWRIELPRARRYKVEIHWACAADSAGNRYVLEGPQGRLGGRVEATRSWNDYQKAAAGELELDAGPQRLIFRAEGPIRGYLVDLKGVVLRPAE